MTADGPLRDAAPPWAALLHVDGEGCVWIAAPPLPSGTPTTATLVRTTVGGSFISASESKPGTRLPASCPELHVNPDASFCLARRSYRITRDTDVSAFWQDLGEFLVNQHHAARRGRWPAGRWLSHGPVAADRQAEAEAAAFRIGFDAEYEACLEADEGWIADRARLPHARIPRAGPCPRGCQDDASRPIPFRACRHGAVIQRIVDAERSRRAAQAAYFGALRRLGTKCCGRIPGCPLDEERIAA